MTGDVTGTLLRVLGAGLATVQDLGRPGLAHLGIAENGAADGWSARTANLLAGNPAGAPLIEVTSSPLILSAEVDLLLAATGPLDTVRVGPSEQPAWETLVVPAGTRVEVPAPAWGMRTYLAVNGRLKAPVVLGSTAPDRLLGTGRFLRTGDTVRLDTAFDGLTHPHTGIPVFRMGARQRPRRDPLLVEITRGPHTVEFPELADAGLTADYTVSPQSDGIGLRLTGPTPQRSTSDEILSRGVPVGAVEVPPAGGLLLLLRGRLVTAGYPVVAVVTRDSLDRLGQARPGDTVRFSLVDAGAARTTLHRRETDLDVLARRVRTALAGVGLAHVLGSADRSPHTQPDLHAVPASTAA